MISLFDRLEIQDASVRKTRDGYLVANALTARTGVQEYRARDIGLTDRDPGAVVRVYRPPSSVFDENALASMAYRPMTNDHPGEDVTADNWKRLSVGHAGGEVIRDGGYVRVPLVMMDSAAIKDFESGKRELSWGYSCEITMKDGIVPDGEIDAGKAYDAIQTDIRANHIALCDKARGGDKLTFGDQHHKPGAPAVNTKTIIIDGFNVVVTEDAERVINKLQGQIVALTADVQSAQKAAGDQAALVATRDGEIVALKSELADARDPAKLADAAAARARLEAAAKTVLGDAFDFRGKSDADIRRAAVVAKYADAAKDMNDGEIAGAFTILASNTGATVRDPIADSLAGSGGPGNVSDSAKAAEDARKAMIDGLVGASSKISTQAAA